jgi:hypothetical protein
LSSTKEIRAHTCYQLRRKNESPKSPDTRESLGNIEISLSNIEISFFLRSNFLTQNPIFPNRLSAFFNGFPTFFNSFSLSSMAFRFLQRLSNFLQRLSNFPQWLSAFREIQENLSTAASIQKITIRALYFLPLTPQAL